MDRNPQFLWVDDANCRGLHPDTFFPVGRIGRRGNGPAKDTEAAETAVAQQYCWGDGDPRRVCPVREQCLQYALDSRHLHGVWGGTTENERRAMLGLKPRQNSAA